MIDQQVAGQYDITGGNYVSYIQHYVDEHQPLEIIAEGSVMQEGTQAIYTMPNSKIKTLAGLKGHVLGINAPLNINYLLAASVLTENGIKLSPVRLPHPADPVPDHGGRSSPPGRSPRRRCPSRSPPPPSSSTAWSTLSDLNQGATEQFPIQGYVVTKAWAEQNPDTLKAFVAALTQGQEIADTSRSAVEQAMESLKGPQNGEIPPIVASVMAVNIYPTAIDQVRIQRVADVMYQFGLLKPRFNVTPMIGP